MSRLPRAVGESVTEASPDRYLPFAVARKTLKAELESITPNDPVDAARRIVTGTMPPRRGLIGAGATSTGAYDLVSGSFGGANRETLTVGPTFRDAVDKYTRRIVGEGLIILTVGEEIKVCGAAVLFLSTWQAEEDEGDLIVRNDRVGTVKLIDPFITSLVYTIETLNESTGQVTAIKRSQSTVPTSL